MQQSLPVRHIMVPRYQIRTCVMGDIALGVAGRNINDFSYVPVDDDAREIVGCITHGLVQPCGTWALACSAVQCM